MNQRVQGKDDVQQTFRSLLDRPRTGDSIEEDWKLLLTRQPLFVKNVADFDDAIKLYFKQ